MIHITEDMHITHNTIKCGGLTIKREPGDLLANQLYELLLQILPEAKRRAILNVNDLWPIYAEYGGTIREK
jgi:hypothetical protein